MGPIWQANDATNYQLNPMWHYALKCYGKPEVQSTLLQLQDRFDMNVNAVLWFGFLARSGRSALCTAQSHLNDWNQRYTQPIRALRRRAKSLEPASLYQHILELELQSEFLEQCLLMEYEGKSKTGATAKMCFVASLEGWGYKVEGEELQTLLEGLQLNED